MESLDIDCDNWYIIWNLIYKNIWYLFCSGKKISAAKIELHESYCFKNVKKCVECDMPIDKEDLENHMKTHAKGGEIHNIT